MGLTKLPAFGKLYRAIQRIAYKIDISKWILFLGKKNVITCPISM